MLVFRGGAGEGGELRGKAPVARDAPGVVGGISDEGLSAPAGADSTEWVEWECGGFEEGEETVESLEGWWKGE